MSYDSKAGFTRCGVVAEGSLLIPAGHRHIPPRRFSGPR